MPMIFFLTLLVTLLGFHLVKKSSLRCGRLVLSPSLPLPFRPSPGSFDSSLLYYFPRPRRESLTDGDLQARTTLAGASCPSFLMRTGHVITVASPSPHPLLLLLLRHEAPDVANEKSSIDVHELSPLRWVSGF